MRHFSLRFRSVALGLVFPLSAALGACSGAPPSTALTRKSPGVAAPESQTRQTSLGPCATAQAIAGVALNQSPPEQSFPLLKGVEPSDIRVSGDSWKDLVDKVQPTLAYHSIFRWGAQLITICDPGEPNDVRFEFDNAFTYRTSDGALRWAVAGGAMASQEVLPDDPAIGELNLRPHGVARIAAVTPTPGCDACGTPDHARLLSASGVAGRVYALTWMGIMNRSGSGHPIQDTLLYLFRDNSGRWALLGEGHGESRGKVGRECYESTTTAEEVAPNARSSFGLEIRLTVRESSVACGEGASRDGRVTYEQYVLDGTALIPQRRGRAYLLAESGQTLAAVVHNVATWSGSWDRACGTETQTKEHQSRIEQLLNDRILRLNPGLKPGALPVGARIELPDSIPTPDKRFDLAPLKAALIDLSKIAPAMGAPTFEPHGNGLNAQYAGSNSNENPLTVIATIAESAEDLTATLQESECRTQAGSPSGVIIYETPDQLGGNELRITIQVGVYRFDVYGPQSQALIQNMVSALASQRALREVPGEAR